MIEVYRNCAFNFCYFKSDSMTKSGGVVNRTRFVSIYHEHTGIAMLHVADVFF